MDKRVLTLFNEELAQLLFSLDIAHLGFYLLSCSSVLFKQ